MKTSWIKLSAFLLGATLVLSSCVKTDESAEVIELRKAKVAQMNADVAYRLAQVKYQNADAAIREYQAKYDSAMYLGDITKYEAQAQINIQNAKNELLNAQIQFEKNTKALEVEKLNNPILATLLNDYKVYHDGGTLNSGKWITTGEGIFGLQTYILTEKGTIITLQSKKDGLAYTQKAKEIDLLAKQTDLTDKKARLEILGNARTSGNFDAAITAAKELLTKSVADSVKMQLAYDNAKNLANTASTQLSAAADLYKAADDSVSNWETKYKHILAPYDNTTTNERLDYDAMMLAQTNAIAAESRNQTVLTTWATKYQSALNAKNIAQAAVNTANATYLAAQAIVDALTKNGETPTQAQNDAVTNANTALGNAQMTLSEKEGYYNSVSAEYETAKENYDDSKEAADLIRKDVADYNTLKGLFTIGGSKLPALKTDMDAKKEISYKLNQSRDSISTLYTNAGNIAQNDRSVVNLLVNDRNSINTAIENLEKGVNDVSKAIADLNAQIANLKAGINTGDSNKLVDSEIKISQDKIAVWEALLAKYQAEAAALKAKIDAQ